MTKDDLKNDKQWVTILKDYLLMRNAHFEKDAQNYHIIGIELVSNCIPNRYNSLTLRLNADNSNTCVYL